MAAQTADNTGGNDLSENAYLFHQLDAYPWTEDQEFKGGLRVILDSVQDSAQVVHLTLRAKCYYYARKAGTHVDFDGYKQWVESNNTTNVIPTNGTGHPNIEHAGLEDGYAVVPTLDGGDGGMAQAPKPASFAEICEIIAEGKPIPGIKEIPDTILEGQASESRAGRRKKPWEKDAKAEVGARESTGAVAVDADEKPSWMR